MGTGLVCDGREVLNGVPDYEFKWDLVTEGSGTETVRTSQGFGS